MTQTHPEGLLKSRVIRTANLYWREFSFIQDDNFKELPPEAKDKLKRSILFNQFTQPFYVWKDGESGNIYCLDGKHRTMILEELITEGYDIPEKLPATLIRCKDKQEAAQLVLIYSSMYAKVTQQGLFDFVKMYDLGLEQLKQVIDIPEFSMDRFDQKFDTFKVREDLDDYEIDIEQTGILVKPGDSFQLGDHRIKCCSFMDDDSIADLMGCGYRGCIVITDPPYNLPADFFIVENKRHNNHQDFAMGAGEMTDGEFAVFLMRIMETSIKYTVPGAIHYIFMDWRHVWHMTEAAKAAYGSPTPKQMCVWVKDHMANGSFYRPQQELCFVFSNPAAKNLWQRDLVDEGGFYKDNDELCFIFKNGDGAKHLSHLDMADRIRTNVWKYPSANSAKNPDRYILKDHPTPKPVAMIADAILDTTDPGDIVIDFFLGSGTALIASEKTARICYASEIDPKYVQTTIKRYIHYCLKNGLEIRFKHCNGTLTLNDFSNEETQPADNRKIKAHG